MKLINLPSSSFTLSPYNFRNKILLIHKIIDNGIEIIVKATDMVGFETFISSESFLFMAMSIKVKKYSCTLK